LFVLATAWAAGRADDTGPKHEEGPARLGEWVRAVTDAVLSHHVDPPARQQMILDGLKAVYKAAGRPVPNGLAQKVSAVADPSQIDSLLAEALAPVGDHVPKADPGPAMIEGLLSCVPGGAELIPERQQRVNEQIQGNLYVGIHVALSMDDKAKRPTFPEIFPGGPADRAGVRKGDVLETVDGTTVEGEPLVRVIDRLRGAEGTDVTIGVRTPPSSAVRTLTLRRGRLPRTSVGAVRKKGDGGWDVCLKADGEGPVGYLKVNDITGSTPQEVRAMAQRMEEQGAEALILDLRSVPPASLHATVLLADALLDGGIIGRVRWTDRVETFRAEPDALFRNRPIAVLIDGTTGPEAAWLAAALQDNRRALLVGQPAYPAAGVQTAIPVLGGAYALRLTTGLLERGDGRPIGNAVADRRIPRLVMAFPAGDGQRTPAGSVTPDVAVASRPVPPPSANRRQPAVTLESAAGPAGDPVVARALERLRGMIRTL
jgi:carboxyl-terminal processing protease